MILNEHYRADVKYVLQQSHVVLRVLGIWPSIDRKPSAIGRVANIILVLVSYFLMYCNVVPGILYYAYVDDVRDERVRLMTPVVYSIMALGKYSNLLFNEHCIQSCLRHIKEDWQTLAVDDARSVMMERAKTSRRLFAICGTFMYCGGISYNTIAPLSRGSFVNAQNATIRPVTCRGYYVFFDAQKSPIYEIVFLQQCICGLVMYTVTVTICGLAALFAMHACAQMEILIRMMESLVSESGRGSQRDVGAKLAVVIEHQIRIRNFLHLMEKTLTYSNLVELVGCTTVICLAGYCILVEWQNGNVAGLCACIVASTSIIINMFILCYIGEYITTQADLVSWTCCSYSWYRLPTWAARNFVLVIAASSAPPKITAGKFLDLSVKTFGDVIKTAVVYFNMLRQFIEIQ